MCCVCVCVCVCVCEICLYINTLLFLPSSCEATTIVMLIILSLYGGSAAKNQKQKNNNNNKTFWITAVWRWWLELFSRCFDELQLQATRLDVRVIMNRLEIKLGCQKMGMFPISQVDYALKRKFRLLFCLFCFLSA